MKLKFFDYPVVRIPKIPHLYRPNPSPKVANPFPTQQMNHPDSNSRTEADRWLTAAANLLATRDFQGTKTFAIRARDTDPSGSIHEAVDRILAVADTLILSAGDSSSVDYYSVLQLPQLTQSLELIATHFRRLALLLNPERNPFPFAEHAFRIVSDAWSVLSNPAKKVLYDNELRMSLLGHGPPGNFVPPATPVVPMPASAPASGSGLRPMFLNRVEVSISNSQSNSGGSRQNSAQTSQNTPVPPARPVTTNPSGQTSRRSAGIEAREKSFWTSCPYCFHMYEYAKIYEECVLKCQNCKRAFHGVVIESPPVVEKDSYYSCWGCFPIGYPGPKNDGGSGKGWTPFTMMVEGGDLFPGLGAGKKRRGRPPGKSTGPRVYYDDDEIYVELSDESDDMDVDWRNGTGRKTRKARKGKTPGKGSGNMVAKRPVGRPRKVRDTDNPNVGDKETANVDATASNGVINEGTISGCTKPGEISRGESSKKAVGNPALKRAGRGAKELGKLDLNVEFSNDQVEEPMRIVAVGSSRGAGHGLEDAIEGTGFFEGLDEFLSSLPILSVVGDDKVKAA